MPVISNKLNKSCRQIMIICIMMVITSIRVHASGIDEYQRILKDTEAKLGAIVRQENLRPDSAKKQINELLDATPGSVSVDTGSRNLRKVDLRWLRRDLRALQEYKSKNRQQEAKKIISRIQSMQAASKNIGISKGTDVNAARSKLNSILSRNEYKETFFDSFMLKILNKFSDVLSRIFGGPAAKAIGWVLIGVLLIAVVIAIVYLVLHLAGYFSGRGKKSSQTDSQVMQKQTRPSFESLIGKSEREASEGRYRDAFRSIYLASIIMLDKARLITYTDSGTNWEYMRFIRRQASPEAVEIFGDMTLLFDNLIYGHRDVTRDEYDRCMSQYRQLEVLV
ncbi:MAG: DUF4129 domain-containing protein [Armatimonadota bacterium]